MNYWLIVILNLCILVPAATGLLRFRKINRFYYPIIFCIWLGSLVEITSVILVLYRHSNAVVSNIYVLIESLLLLWQFKRWKLFKKKKQLFSISIALFSILWLLENFYFSTIFNFCSYFRILYSFITVLMSIVIINQLVVSERKSLLKNSSFLLCVGLVFYYTLQALVEAFWVYGVDDKVFSTNVYNISVITNFITNLLYTVAIIWIPPRQRFTLPSS